MQLYKKETQVQVTWGVITHKKILLGALVFEKLS